jgi:VWFA-related protein
MVFRRLPLAAFVCVATLAAQSPPLISLQITALDNHGQPVTDLQTADFRIADDGKPQPPVFTRFLAGSQPPAPLKPNEFSNRSGDPIAHSTVILFDLLNADLTERGRSWTEIVQTLQHLESNDHFYLYLLTREATLFPVHPLPANEEQVSSADAPWAKEVEPLLNRAMSAVNRLELQELRVDVDARVKATFRALKQLTEQMAPLPGRKSLVWLSAGVPISDVGLDHQLKDNNPLIRQFAVELNRANIPTYTVDQSPGVGQVGSRDTLEAIASLSGGRYFTSDSTGLAITQAVTDARAAYQVGFYPAAKNRDGKFHKLHVTTVRKGVQIRTRQDYRVDPDATTAQEGFESASVAPFDDPGIGLRVTVSPSPNESKLTRFQIEVDPADLLLASTSASLELGFIDDDGTGRTKAIVTSPFDASPENGRIELTKDRALAPAVKKVRIVVVDMRTGSAGSLNVSLPAE